MKAFPGGEELNKYCSVKKKAHTGTRRYSTTSNGNSSERNTVSDSLSFFLSFWTIWVNITYH